MKIVSSSTALLSDALTFVAFPSANLLSTVVGGAVGDLFQSRLNDARDIAVAEMNRCERANFDIPEDDAFVGIVFRYSRAAIEGTARLNLKLLAMVMSGQAIDNSISSTEFNEFAEILSTLRRTEIVYLGTLLELHRIGELVPKNESTEFYELDQSIQILLKRRLSKSNNFLEDKDIQACEARLLRTGLIYPATIVFSGSTIYAPSNELFRLESLVRFDELVADTEIVWE